MNLSTPIELVLLVGAATYVLASLLTPGIRKWAVATGCVSRPTQDRWGRRVVPRLGGISISLGFLAVAGWGATQDSRILGLLLGGILILAIGLIDDFKRLHPYSKLVGQIVASCLVVLSGIHVDLPIPWLEIPLTIGWLVLMMNVRPTHCDS